MQLNDYVRTPRFGTVRINAVLTPKDARTLGYTEPTHYEDEAWRVMGKHLGDNRMVFAAIPLEISD